MQRRPLGTAALGWRVFAGEVVLWVGISARQSSGPMPGAGSHLFWAGRKGGGALFYELAGAASAKLTAVFGEGVPVLIQLGGQSPQGPCFCIGIPTGSHQPYLGRRKKLTASLQADYVPSADSGDSELLTVAWQLYEAMEVLSLEQGELVRGGQMRHEISGGVLHFYVTYSMFLNTEQQEEKLEDLQVTSGIAGDIPG